MTAFKVNDLVVLTTAIRFFGKSKTWKNIPKETVVKVAATQADHIIFYKLMYDGMWAWVTSQHIRPVTATTEY